jgi:hypothetical protein
MKAKIFTLVMAVAVMLLIPIAVQGGPKVSVNGEEVKFADTAPKIVEERTLVPLRGVFEMLGFEIQWNQQKKQATLVNAEFEVVVTIGVKDFTVNGKKYTKEVPAQLIGNSTMVPIRAILQSVGVFVDWDASTNTVVVTDKKPPATTPVEDMRDVSAAFIGQTGTIRSAENNRYVSARLDKKDNPLNATRTTARGWETFTVVDAGDGMVALRASNGRYVSAVLGDKDVPLRATAQRVNNWERFRIFEGGYGFYIQAANGNWVSTRVNASDNPLRATSDKPQAWERFILDLN